MEFPYVAPKEETKRRRKKNFKKREKKKRRISFTGQKKEVTKRICLDSASEEATKNEFPSLGC